ERMQWVLLAYRLPREPSSPRIALWRKLKRLGVAQLLDGLVALPLDSRNRERLEWLANDVVEAGGEATIWIGALASGGQGRELADPVLWEIAKVVHEADLDDERYDAPEASGLDVLLRGLSMTHEDEELLALAAPLFDGLYEFKKRAILLGREPS